VELEGGKTQITMLCDSTLLDKFGNDYRMEGPYYLECGEMQEFQYLTERRGLHSSHCYSWPDTPASLKLLGTLTQTSYGL
jgi:hypothetical protein